MADEVRDRTILVKINFQQHSWSDIEIRCLFSEIGIVDEGKYLPTGSGFHSQVRFQTIYDSEWASYYYNGRSAHEGCCEIELHHPKDVISGNNQRITEVLFGIRDTLKMRNTACQVLEEMRRPIDRSFTSKIAFDEVDLDNPEMLDNLVLLKLKEGQELLDTRMDDGKEKSIQFFPAHHAHQMFDKMPSREIAFFDALVNKKPTLCSDLKLFAISVPYDRGKLRHSSSFGDEFDLNVESEMVYFNSNLQELVCYSVGIETVVDVLLYIDQRSWVFDPGGIQIFFEVTSEKRLHHCLLSYAFC